MATHRGQSVARSAARPAFAVESLENRRLLAATITAQVFYDFNGNGIFEPDGAEPEAVAGNYRIYLDNNDNGVFDEGVDPDFFTDMNGQVVIGDLLPNTAYKVGVAPRDVEGTSTLEVKTVNTGADGSTVSAGVFGIARSRISGRVFTDLDGDGVYDLGEGRGAVRVFLDLNKNGVFDEGDEQTWTAATFLADGITPNPNAGNYRFNFIDAGDYEVRVFPAHFQVVDGANPRVVNLGIMQTVSGQDFKLVDKAAIGGQVFNDTNGDGIRQANETLAENVRVYADLNDNGVFDPGEPSALSVATAATVKGAQINYHIDGVDPGTYTVRVVLPSGVTASTPASRTVPLVAGQETVFTSFGLVGASSGAVNDFNNDGKSDIIVTVGGTSTIWFMDGTKRLGTAALPNLGAGFTLATYGDFNGDGRPDLLVHNAATGVPKIITLNGTTVTGEVILPAANTAWKPYGAGDFDGDGDLDIVWRNQSTGQNTTWRMNGTALQSFKALPSTADNNWFIAGVADFDNDGDEDIVWRHAVNGRNTLWLMNNTSIPTFRALPQTVDQGWRPVAVTHFNGDNIPDILWIHATTGANSIWLMQPAGQPIFTKLT